MADDEVVANRVREQLASADRPWDEIEMFGGLAFMVGGHMTVGVMAGELMVRVGKEGQADALAMPHARVMDFTGRPMSSIVVVEPEGFGDDADLAGWVARGLAFTSTLPPK